jgi:hypothetical protein
VKVNDILSLWKLTWANAMRSPNCPSEERNTSNWDEVCFDREEMSDLMDRKPNGWQRAHPEDEEANEVTSVRARTCDPVVKRVKGRPLKQKLSHLVKWKIWRTHDGSDHQGDTLAAYKGLDTILLS